MYQQPKCPYLHIFESVFPGSILNTISILILHHQQNQYVRFAIYILTYSLEIEQNGKILILEVLLVIINAKLGTTIFRKETNNNICLHWRSFALFMWKKGTLEVLMKHAPFIIFFRKNCTIQKRVPEINGYPKCLFKQTFDSFITSNKIYKLNNKTKTVQI